MSVSDTSNALIVLKQLPSWFEAYNEHAPHKVLKMWHQDNLLD